MAERAAEDARRWTRAAGPPRAAPSHGDQPTVAIVGYPNVGKSTLFNRLAGRRDAVVDAVAGVTRDRRQAGAEWNGRAFQLSTPAASTRPTRRRSGSQVAAQAMRAIEEADLILFVVDVKVAPTAGDLEVARAPAPRRPRPGHHAGRQQVRRPAPRAGRREPALDGAGRRPRGLGPARAGHRGPARRAGGAPARGAARRHRAGRAPPAAICIIGRPNVGKSSILNALLGEERVVVHERPGTTRDPIDTLIEVDGRADRPDRHRRPAPARADARGRGALQPDPRPAGRRAQRRGPGGGRRHRGPHRGRPRRGRPRRARPLRHPARR